MAPRHGVSSSSLARIGRKRSVQPHRIETFKFSTAPQLEPKLRDVVGLYMSSPENAVVLSIEGTLGKWVRVYRADNPDRVRPAGRRRRTLKASRASFYRWRNPAGPSPRAVRDQLTLVLNAKGVQAAGQIGGLAASLRQRSSPPVRPATRNPWPRNPNQPQTDTQNLTTA
ncbi:hypothetical protein [Arthrobacter sp. AZCC_0090]|uniref:hypothetical protein n=1 Tax=Arthrobacter sp. AZCC_0090 TaxID=2735881 RepID=UPI00161C9B0A|nr:hypothetical protein [Arthrobacter sp. AZCC_0090]MBB6406282.1 hypothetical protein [Arthrobacter sp. AZCC_0090]